VAPKSNDLYHYNETDRENHVKTEVEIYTSQEIPRIGYHQKLGERHRIDYFSELPQGTNCLISNSWPPEL
jgi:hypothetical protein